MVSIENRRYVILLLDTLFYIPKYYFSETSEFWDKIENRREFLLSFAAKEGFDPWDFKIWRNKPPLMRAQGV